MLTLNLEYNNKVKLETTKLNNQLIVKYNNNSNTYVDNKYNIHEVLLWQNNAAFPMVFFKTR